MKASRILAVMATVLAVSSMAYAGPHNFDMFSSNSGSGSNNFAFLSYTQAQGAGNPTFIAFTYVTSQSASDVNSNGFNGSADYAWTSPGPNTNNCNASGFMPGTGIFDCYQPLSFFTNANAIAATGTFSVGVNPVVGTSENNLATQSLLDFTTGSSAFFWTADDGSGSPGPSFSSYGSSNTFEIDISIGAQPAGGGDQAVPAGTLRLVYALAGNSGSTFSIDPSDANGDYVVSGVAGAGSVEESAGVQVVLVDAEFDPNVVPEPTTMLLLGSGMILVAKRFRR